MPFTNATVVRLSASIKLALLILYSFPKGFPFLLRFSPLFPPNQPSLVGFSFPLDFVVSLHFWLTSGISVCFFLY